MRFESKKTQGLKYGRALWVVVADKWAGLRGGPTGVHESLQVRCVDVIAVT